MSESLPQLLLRLSEHGCPAFLSGTLAAAHAGAEFDRLLRKRVLIEREAITEWDACAGCECDRRARLIDHADAGPVARCALDPAFDIPLDDADLREYEIDVAALVREIAHLSGLKGGPELIASDLWLVGEGDRVIFLAQGSALSDALSISMLRTAARGRPIAVIGPTPSASLRRQFEDANIHLSCFAEVFQESLGIDLHAFRHGLVRLVIDRSKQAATLDGVEHVLSLQLFKLLVFLAEGALGRGGFISATEIEHHLWDEKLDQIVRPVRDVVSSLRAALRKGDSSSNPGRLIETRTGIGYRLRLAPNEIVIKG